jgi:hypothetical protein
VASSVYSRTLQKAAELIGGYQKLCRRLQVPPPEMQRWIADKAVPPMGIFLRAVDLILDGTAPPSNSDPADSSAPRDCSSAGEPSATWL